MWVEPVIQSRRPAAQCMGRGVRELWVTPTAILLVRWLLILPELDRGQSAVTI
jgi:hypothetical protein